MDADVPIGGRRNPASPHHLGAGLRLLAAPLLIAAVLLAAGEARADGRGSLREGVEQAGAADFQAALRSFEVAESSTDLRSDDLVRLYGHRAVVHFALGDRESMEADLARLLAIAPGAELPLSAPPPVGQALERMRALGVSSPRLRVEAADIARGVRIRASVEGGPPGLVHRVRVLARPGDGERWIRGDGELAILARSGAAVRWYAQAIGPGGAVVASDGTAEEPNVIRVGGEATPARRDPSPLTDARPVGSDDGRRRRWWLIGTGATAVVSAAVVTAVLLAGGGGSDTTRVTGPTLVP